MHWLSVLSEGKEKRVEPYFAFNFGTGTMEEALAWVEYCNGTKDTYYANLRRKNGHPEPYNVKYWALGNEVSFRSLSFYQFFTNKVFFEDVGTMASW
jgi:alpha-N-arabinofuranosidase